jgi:inward rectifier potassium channel
LYGMTEQELLDADMEVLYFINAFDDHFSNVVKQRTSYTGKELVFGAKFLPMFHRSEDNNTTILDLSKINAYEKAELPEMVISSVNA